LLHRFEFEALGMPPQPQGSLAFKGMRKGKAGKKPTAILTSDNDQLKPWRLIVATAARIALPADWATLDEPVRVSAEFRMKELQRPRWLLAATKPDVDKLLRAIFDSMADAGVYTQDSRVAQIGQVDQKYADWANPAGVFVRVEWGDLRRPSIRDAG
jgi:Holliday junction resolvase RusA-like endonuclease